MPPRNKVTITDRSVVVSYDIGANKNHITMCAMRSGLGSRPEILKWEQIDLGCKTQHEITKRLPCALKAAGIGSEDVVLIERQHNRNVRAGTTSFLLAMYYYHLTDWEPKTRHLEFMSPTKKFTTLTGLWDSVEKKVKSKKIMSARMCKRYLSTYYRGTTWPEFFESFEKQDDLADTFLMTLCKLVDAGLTKSI